MSRFRLHATSWIGLVAVCVLLFFANGGRIGGLGPAVEGFPWSSLEFGKVAFPVNICLGAFVLFGTVAAIEIWCRAHGPPRVSLLSLFAVLSAFCFYLSAHVVPFLRDRRTASWWLAELVGVSRFLIIILFGVAVVGWVKLIGHAFKRR